MKKEEEAYTDELKKQIVALYNNGKSVTEILAEYKIESSTLCKWINDFNNTHEVSIDLEKLIPEYVECQKLNKDFYPFDYLGMITDYKPLLTISKFLFPDVQLIEGCFFLKDSRQWSGITGWWESSTYAANLEIAINDICLELVLPANSDIEDLQCKEMINILQLSWSLYFKSKFPEYNLVIDVYENPYDGWSITVFQIDNLSIKKPPLSSILQARERLSK